MRTVAINTFNAGMVSDPRLPQEAVSRLCQHFDSYTYPHKLVPYHSGENGDTSASTNQIGGFAYANNKLYGLSFAAGASQKLFTKSDNTTQTWDVSVPSNMNVTAAFDGNCFIDYKSTLYMSQASKLSSYVYGSATYTADVNAGGYAVIAQPVIHPADGYIYFPTATGIISYNGSAWNATAFVLPDTNYTVVGVAAYGNYLAIACVNTSASKSIVLLWGRDTTINTVAENIDWGGDTIAFIEAYDSYLIGVSRYQASSTAFKDRVVFRYYQGGAPFGQEFHRLTVDGTSAVVYKNRQKLNNRIYFMASMQLAGTHYDGVWTLGRTTAGAPFSVVFDRLANNDTGLTSGVLNGFIVVSDFTYISYQSSGAYGMSKTDDQANFTATSIYETTINPEIPERIRAAAGDRTRQKQLMAVALSTEPLTSGQQVVLKYKAEGGSWNTIFTGTTVGENTFERTFDAAGSKFLNAREYQFRIESTGGAEITELKYKYEALETQL